MNTKKKEKALSYGYQRSEWIQYIIYTREQPSRSRFQHQGYYPWFALHLTRVDCLSANRSLDIYSLSAFACWSSSIGIRTNRWPSSVGSDGFPLLSSSKESRTDTASRVQRSRSSVYKPETYKIGSESGTSLAIAPRPDHELEKVQNKKIHF